MQWGNRLVEAEDQRYWELLSIYLLVRATLGEGALAHRLSQALDDGDPRQIEAALTHYAAQPAALRERVEAGDRALEFPLRGRAARHEDRYWALLMLYLRVGAVLGECALYQRLGAALDAGSDARIVAELVYFESLPDPLKSAIRHADAHRDQGILPDSGLQPTPRATLPFPFWGRAAGRAPAARALRRDH